MNVTRETGRRIDILKQIKEAEAEVEKLIETAEREREKLIADAKRKSLEILRESETESTKYAQREVELAKARIAREKEAIIKRGEEAAEKLKAAVMPRVEQASEVLFKKFERLVHAKTS
jgi:V/A-type H+-transporting ATPase subunit G/H